MPTPRFRRRVYLLASTSLVACVLIVTPITVELRLDKPPLRQVWNSPTAGLLPYGERAEDASSNGLKHIDRTHADPASDRRAARARLGLDESVGYALPVVITLSRASAQEGGSGGGGSGGGGSGGGGSGGGGSGGGGSGGGGSGGGSGGASGASGASGSSGASGASGSEASDSSDSGGTSDAFGGVEQVGNDLSADQETETISSGWQ